MNDKTYHRESRQNSAYCRGEMCKYRPYGHGPAGQEQHPQQVFLLLLSNIVRRNCLANEDNVHTDS